jgi:hypothetical protein
VSTSTWITRPRLGALGAVILAAAMASMTMDVNGDSLRGSGLRRAVYSPPRTPWGDPDLQGAYSNTDERGIPMNRPSEFEGFRVQHFPPAELARLNRERSVQFGLEKSEWEQIYEPARINNSRPWLVSDPPDGKIPAVLEARRQVITDVAGTVPNGSPKPWESLDLVSRCITRGLPGSMLPEIYGNSYEILQAPGVVVITYEAIHEARVVLLDARPHVDARIRTYLGDARGWFEGDSLVVETTNFTSRTPFHLSSEQLKIVERFTPIAPNVLQWSVTLDDATAWTRPWTFGMNLTTTLERPLEFACHEGNYSLRNILAAAPDMVTTATPED